MNKESYNFIEKYDRSSEKNSEKISYFIKQVFVPVTFLGGGVPHYAHSNEELCTFADMWIHDPEGITNNLLSELNDHEFTMLKNISTKVWELTKDMNFQVAPKTGLLRQIYQKRLINRFFPNAETVLEVGPGSGYLCLMLALDGKKVFSTDVTQCFYIWQNFLFKNFNILNELVSDDIDLENKKITHIPWWKFINFQNICQKLDLITVNHALCEMSNHSVRHLLSIANKIGNPKFFMESYGSYKYSHKRSDIAPLFREFGYKETFNKDDIHIFEYDDAIINFNKSNYIKVILYLPFFRKLFRFFRSESSLSIQIFKMIKSIFFKKSDLKIKNKYDYKNVMKYYKDLTGKANYRTPCEEFYEDICDPKIKGVKHSLAYAKFDDS